ncbi:hypothetical protein DND132_2482 [Pseudodesulfovibrio mercurii]|uniref:Uncharacterized protein n=2 Tax=Pseudodesulfovibrio mercurii TaxID=641491 RepID=F0JCK5_9BACT|nr:hypothetical protein DND132_2482 [Pseudodesulfovibrio mercurii]
MLNDDELREALETMYQLRFCPPDRILFAPDGNEDLRRHVETCGVCRERRAMDRETRDAWGAVAEGLARAASPSRPDAAPGQVWSLSPRLEGWGARSRHYNAPMVLILRRGKDAVEAAQLCPDAGLAGPADVDLGPDYGLAQGWNRLSLPVAALDACWGSVPASLVDATLRAAVADDDAPEDSPLYFFRSLERAVAAEMGARAADLAPVEAGPSLLERVVAYLRGVGAVVADGARNAEEALASAIFPPEWAAARAAEGDLAVVVVARLDQPDIEIELKTVALRVLPNPQGGVVFASARHGLGAVRRLSAWHATPSGGLEPGKSDLSPDGERFMLVFTELPPDEARIDRLRIVAEV